jgi:nicotinamidase-related amidase
MFTSGMNNDLPIPAHFDPARTGEIWKVAYETRAAEAVDFTQQYSLKPAARDNFKVALIAIDVQNTFCIPGFELFVGGRSGNGAVDDNRRLCEFIYRNLGVITHITATLDTHQAMQIFHAIFLVDEQGRHPAPLTPVSYEDLLAGRWRFNPAIAASLDIESGYGQKHLLHYAQELKERHKYDLTIWPYHVMLGSIGHALVPAVEEAIFFHTIARNSQADFEIKGSNPLTEHYSAIGPEVLDGPYGEQIAHKNSKFIQVLQRYDAVIIAGQAKSHCVAWTIDDLLNDIRKHDENLVEKVYLLEDCTSPVVIPGVVDYSEQADAAFRKFASAGMHIVRSDQPIHTWLRSR